jgi:hypothetical protein
MSDADLNEIDDLPKGGPLEEYRLKASFNWKRMKLFLETIDVIKFKVFRIEF